MTPPKGSNKSQKPQGDATGKAMEEAQAAAAEEQKEAAEHMAMATAQRQHVDETATHDPVSGEPLDEGDGDDSVHVLGDEDDAIDLGTQIAENDEVTWRSNGDYPSVTIGQTTYNFEAGKKYKTTRNVYTHMEEKGCVWH